VSFPRRLLTAGEQVVVDLRPSWAFLGWPLVVTGAAVVLAVGLAVAFSPLPHEAVDALLLLVAVTVGVLAGRVIRWLSTSLVLTTARVVERSGVFGRRALEVRLDRINELSYHQSLGARLTRTGEVTLEVGGETGVVTLEHVRRPAAFQSLITEQVAALHARRLAPSTAYAERGPSAPHPPDTPPTGQRALAGSPGSGSVADRLVQLGELRRRGIVSAAEYEAKKAQLLEQL